MEILENTYQSVDEEFWDRNDYRCNAGSDFYPLYKELVSKVRTFAESNNLNANAYRLKLNESEGILDNIANALKAWWSNAPDDRFWYGFHETQLTSKPEEWTGVSPIDPGLLDCATARYLERPWMQMNTLDRYILLGFVADAIYRISDSLLSGSIIGKTNWAYILSGGKLLNTILWGLGINIIKFMAIWVLLPIIAGIAYYLNYFDVALWIFGIYCLVVIYRLATFPKRFMYRRKLKHDAESATEKLRQLINIYRSIDVYTVNPNSLRARISEAEKNGVLFMPAVYSIVDRSIMRDPSAFTINEDI